MKEFDDIGLTLCRIQAETFALSAKKTNCSSAIFIRRFMNSKVVSRFDRQGILLEICDPQTLLEDIQNEYGPSDYGKEKYHQEELYWMGYLYRYWCYTWEKSSKQVYQIIKPKELRQLYYPYHSLDPAQAIARILEAQNTVEEDHISRGVALLKKRLHTQKELK